MDSLGYATNVRHHIDEVLAAPGSRDAMVARTLTFNDQLTEAQIAPIVDQLEAFVRGTPDLIDLTSLEAQRQGSLEALTPVLEDAMLYFFEADDLIPDHLGLYGLLDDAYLTQKYLLTASQHHHQQYGVPLLADELMPAVDVVRDWIGHDEANQLDAMIAVEAEQGFNWKGALVAGAVGVGALALLGGVLNALSDSGGGGRTGGPGSWGNSWEDEMARMGAEVGISMPW